MVLDRVPEDKGTLMGFENERLGTLEEIRVEIGEDLDDSLIWGEWWEIRADVRGIVLFWAKVELESVGGRRSECVKSGDHSWRQ